MSPERLRRFAFPREGPALVAYDSGGDGLPVLFQHGLCGDIAQIAEAFPDDPAYRLVALECAGHGASQAGGPYAIARFAEDVFALGHHLGLERPVIGGISMGAAIAARLAVRRPGLARAVVLARPAWVAEPAPANMAPNAEVGRLLAALPPDEARKTFSRGDTRARLAREAPDNLRSLENFFGREPVAETSALLTAISADGPGVTEAELAGLALPTLVLATGEDFVHPLGHAERLAQLIPGARLERLAPKGVDKAAYLRDFHAALRSFLKDF